MKILKTFSQMWVLINYDHIVTGGIYFLRRDAVKDAEESYGEPWAKIKKHHKIIKVDVQRLFTESPK